MCFKVGKKMIFIKAINENILQVKDKTRIDVSETFYTGSPITDIEIKPESLESFISVFSEEKSNWFLDWAYNTSGSKTVTVRATDGTDTVTENVTIDILSEADDNLYSNDSQLFTIEGELKNYLRPGKNSYKNIHREAQRRILDYLDRKRIWNKDGTRIEKDQLNLNDSISRWSLYEALVIIYEDLLVSVGDKFRDKTDKYTSLRNDFRTAGALRIDKDKNGTIDDNTSEIQEMKSFRLIKR